jgi:hypothetical protein
VSAASPALAGDKRPDLDQALKANAPKVLAYLRGTGKQPRFRHVGVLKFLVQKGDEAPGDNVGPLNLRIADRLEVALVLALQDEQIRVLRRASDMVTKAGNRRANHLTEEGRKAFFGKDRYYAPAWGMEKGLHADAFLTGLVKLDEQAGAVAVTIRAFDQTGKEPEDVCRFEARADPRTLTEAGVSYAVPRGGALDPTQLQVMAKPAARVGEDAPVELQILYNGKVVPVVDGRVRQPTVKERVTFRLRHKNKDGATYGVVLRTNGENTVYPGEHEADDLYCWKWILAPGAGFPVAGYQKSPTEANRFTVSPVSEADKDEVRYNEHAGTFTAVVFRAKEGAKDKVEIVRNDKDLTPIARGHLRLDAQPERLAILQDRLRQGRGDDSDPNRRGFIRQGPPVRQEVEQVDFKPYEVPVCSFTIRYYQPEGND